MRASRHGRTRVIAVAVRADFVSELLSDRRAAHDDLGLPAEPGSLQGVDDRFHHRHGGGQEGRERDDAAVLLLNGLDEPFRRHVHAQVDDLKAAPFEHRGHEDLADVVQVALDGADHDASGTLHAPLEEVRRDQPEGGLHGSGGDQQFGHEVLVALKPLADLVHRRNHRLGQQGCRIDARGQGSRVTASARFALPVRMAS